MWFVEKCTHEMDMYRLCHEELLKMHRIIFGEIFIFISLHILTGGDMNSLC